MRGAILLAAALAIAAAGAPHSAKPEALAGALNAATVCDAAIALAERGHSLPAGLLGAIGRVESGRRDPASGTLRPWPWTIDVEGEGHQFNTEAAAIAAVRGYLGQGRRSIDVGCMQVNLAQHPDAFTGLGAAFDPVTNARYAADFLTQLRQDSPDWLTAAGLYHSATPALALPYRLKVEAALQQAGAPTLPMTLAERPPPGATLAMGLPTRPWGEAGRGFFHVTALRPEASARLAMAPSGPKGRGLAAYRAMAVRRAG